MKSQDETRQGFWFLELNICPCQSIWPQSCRHRGAEKAYPFKAAVAGGIGSALCGGSWDVRDERRCDSEGDKEDDNHGGDGSSPPLDTLYIA